MRNWTARATTYAVSRQISLATTCFGFAAANYSDVTVYINNVPLLPSASATTLGGQMSVIDNRADGGYQKGMIDINFEPGLTRGYVVIFQIMDI